MQCGPNKALERTKPCGLRRSAWSLCGDRWPGDGKMSIDTRAGPAGARWLDHLRGHALLFPRPRSSDIDAAVGTRLLLIALALELTRIVCISWLRPVMPLGMLMPFLLAATLAALPLVARLRLASLGFRPWRGWSRVEQSYFVQIMSGAATVTLLFAFLRIRSGGTQALGSDLLTVVVPYACFGFYQEVVYRGAIQRAVIRRLGVPIGILAANLLFTFGPLHWNYLRGPEGTAWPMLIGIFVMGLFFGALYYRSGNLWLPACFHGAGNALMVWQFSASAA